MMSTLPCIVLLRPYNSPSTRYYTMNISDTMSQIELNKTIIQRYFQAYNNKNEAIFDDIISGLYRPRQ
jgi:hypothetical protein